MTKIYTMSRDSKGPRKSFSKGNSSNFNRKKTGSSSDRPRRSFKSEGAPYKKREDDDRPKRKFSNDDSKPFVKRADGKYESRSPKKSFGDREKRPFKKDGDFEKPRRNYRDDDSKKSFGDREKRSFKKDGDFEKPRRNYREGGERSFQKGYSKPSYKSFKEDKAKKQGPKRTSDQQNVSEDAVRLNRYIANAGICSRREADVLIATGVVTVNGKIITEMGYKVNPTDVVTYGGVPIKNETKKYLLLNKPKDYITTMDDPESRKTVMDLVRKACKERLYPVGRLDRNTTGVLLFTNDGDLTAKLTHPKFEVRKVYHVTLDKKLTSEDYKQLNEGLELADGFIKPDAAEFVGTGKTELGIEIHSGKNRIVRRMFEHLGYEVIKLDRVAFGGLTKKDLPKGKFRFLTDKEISFLKMLG